MTKTFYLGPFGWTLYAIRRPHYNDPWFFIVNVPEWTGRAIRWRIKPTGRQHDPGTYDIGAQRPS